MPTGEECKAGRSMPEKKPPAKYNKEGYSRGVLVAWQFRAHTTWSVRGGIEPSLLPSPLQKHTTKLILKGARCSSFFYKTIIGLKHDIRYLGMNKLSGELAASHVFVFVLWL